MTMNNVKPRRWKRIASATKLPSKKQTIGEELIEGFQPHPGRRMSEEEFVNWVGEKTRAEWVDGEVILMSPVNLEHDQIQGWLYRLIASFVEAHEVGRICGSEYSVRLPGMRRRRLTDLFFIARAREGLLKKTYLDGAPDLVIEVVSPDSTSRDYREKFDDYQAGGVPEYWIINPIAQTVNAHKLTKGKYLPISESQGIIRSNVLKGFFLKPAWLWYQPFPKLDTALRELGIK